MRKFRIELEVAGQYKVIDLGYAWVDNVLNFTPNSESVVFRGNISDCYAFIKLNEDGYYGKN